MTNNELAHRLQAAYIDAAARNAEAAATLAEAVDDTTDELLNTDTSNLPLSFQIGLEEMASALRNALAKIA